MSTLSQGTVVGRWGVESLIARGGQATVYRAVHLALGRPAALKVFHPHVWADPAFRTRFTRECDALVALEHPSIIPVYDAGEHDGRGYLVMRLARGGSLADRLARGPMDPREAVGVLTQVAAGLDAAHRAGRLHRDVKPGNVLLEPDGHAWLADFGVARRMSATTPTGDGDIVGTIPYMAPEVIAGEPPTAAADRYALAVVAFESLTGRRPFAGEEIAALVYDHLHRDAPRVSALRPGVPRGLDRAVAAGLRKEPRRRPRTAADLVAAMSRALPPGEVPVALPLPPPPAPPTGPGGTVPLPRPRRPRRRRRLGAAMAVVLAGTVLVAGSLAGLAVVLGRGGGSQDAPARAAARKPALPPVPTPAGDRTGRAAAAADLPGVPAGRPAAVTTDGGVRVAAVAGVPGHPAREALGLARAELVAQGLQVRYLVGRDDAPLGLLASVPGDLAGTGPQWALLLVGDGTGAEDRAVAELVQGRGWDPARFAERLAAARPGALLPV